MAPLALLLSIGSGAQAVAGEVEVGVEVGIGLQGGLKASKRVKTLQELKGEGVIFQRLDYSCGSAALGTLLHQEFGDAITEREIIRYILQSGNVREILRRQGFSLLDLKRFVESRGYAAVGYRLDLESLAELRRPVIAPIVVHGYRHFVVVRGIREGRAFLSDPARGRLTIPLGSFKAFWFGGHERRGEQEEGIGFVVFRKGEEATAPGEGSLQEEEHPYLDDQQVRALVRDRSFSVTPVPGEF